MEPDIKSFSVTVDNNKTVMAIMPDRDNMSGLFYGKLPALKYVSYGDPGMRSK